jgi:hypothetical protein
MENQSQSSHKKSFWKTPLGILVAIFFFPFFLTYWVYIQNWNPKVKWGLIGGFWLLALISMVSNPSYKKGYEAEQATVNTQTASNQTNPTQAPTAGTDEPSSDEAYDTALSDLFSQMEKGGDSTGTAYVTIQDGNIQAMKQPDGTWLVTRIDNTFPELFAETGVKTMTYNFIKDIYSSKFPIKQAGMTINGTGGKYFRALLGANQASSNKEWKSYGPTNFYKWMKSIETSVDEPRENRTVIDENL